MKRGLSFTVLFLMLFNFVTCFANDRSFEIYKVEINAVIMENGDVDVTEYLYYKFDGNFNELNRELNSKGTDGYIINSISVIDMYGVEMVANKSNEGEENTYQVSQDGYKTSVKMISNSLDEDKIFKVNYIAKNVAKKYDSKSELYWSFYSVKNIQYVKEANINISVDKQELTPKNSEYKIFGDGSLLTGYIDGEIRINYNKLSSMIGIDLIMPTEFLSNSPLIANDGSESEETNENTPINNEKTDDSNNEGALFTLIITGVIVIILIIIIIDNKKQNEAIEKYRNGYKFSTNVKNIDSPSNMSPALVNLLINSKNISREMISSALFYLCKLGYYSVREVKYTEKGFFSDKVKNDLIFKRDIKRNSPSQPHLNFIVELFFIYETNNEFSLNNIQKCLTKRSEARYFASKLNEWKNIVSQDAKQLDFFTTIRKKEVLTNEAYSEKLKWLTYKDYIESIINSNENLIEMKKVDTMLVYVRALGINKSAIETFTNTLIRRKLLGNDLSMNLVDNTNNSCCYDYYLTFMNNMEYIYKLVTADNIAGSNDT